MDLLSSFDWEQIKAGVNNAADTFFQDSITWKRVTKNVDRYGERDFATYQDITLPCFINYDWWRRIPTFKEDKTGEYNQADLLIIFKKAYLSAQSYLTTDGYFNYNPSLDKFVVKGKLYKPVGDTLLSQVKENPMLFQLMLRKDIDLTGVPLYG